MGLGMSAFAAKPHLSGRGSVRLVAVSQLNVVQ